MLQGTVQQVQVEHNIQADEYRGRKNSLEEQNIA
jgi:hypothetical protein